MYRPSLTFVLCFACLVVPSSDATQFRWVNTQNCRGTVLEGGSDHYNEYWLDWVYFLSGTEIVNLIEFGVATGPLMERTFRTFLDAIKMYNGPLSKSGVFSRSQFHGLDMSETHLEATQSRIEGKFGNLIATEQLKLIEGTLPLDFKYPEGVTFDGAAIFRTLHFLNEHETIKFLRDLLFVLHAGRPVIATVETIFLPIVPDHERRVHLERDRAEGMARAYLLKELPADYTAETKSVGKRYFHTKESLTLLFEVAGYQVIKCDYIDRGKNFPEKLRHQDPVLMHLNSKLSLGIVAIPKPRWHPLQLIFKSEVQKLVEGRFRRGRLRSLH